MINSIQDYFCINKYIQNKLSLVAVRLNLSSSQDEVTLTLSIRAFPSILAGKYMSTRLVRIS